MATTVRVNFVGDTKDLNRAIDDVDGKAGGLSSRLDGVGKAAAIGLAGGVLAGGAALFSMADAAAQDEKAATALAKTIENVTGATKESTGWVEEWISKQGKAFGVADDDLRPALDSLIRGTKDLDAATELSTLAMDISAATGKDLTSVADALSKAYNGQLGPLKKLDPALTDLVKEGASADEVFGKLSQTFEGQAAAAADTTAGKLAIAKLQFAEMQEEIGAKVIPILASLATWLVEDVIPAMEKMSAWIDENVIPVLKDMGVWINDNVVPALQAFGRFIRDDVGPALADLGRWINENIVPALQAIGRFIRDEVVPALQTFARFIQDDVVPVIQTLFGWYQKWIEWQVKVIEKAVEVGVKVAEVVGDIIEAVTDVIDFFTEVPGELEKAGKGMFDFIKDSFRSAVNFVIDGWNGLEFKIPGFDPPGPGPSFGGFTLGVPEIPRLAKGGIVTSPTLALIGEAGPEAVVPLSRGGGMGATVNVYALDPRTASELVVAALRDAGIYGVN